MNTSDSGARNTPNETTFGLLPSDRLFVSALSLLVFVLLCLHWWRISDGGTETIELERHPSQEFAFRIDINSATWVEWMQLEGIGETTARSIISDIAENGPFSSIDDVQRVRGIGPKTIMKIRPYLRCHNCDTTSSE